MSNTSELKKLTTELNDLTKNMKNAEKEFSKVKKSINKKIDAIRKRISVLKKKDIIISEHAVLRFIERYMGFDIDLIKNKILSEDTKKLIQSMGTGKYPVGEYKLIVKDGVIVTVE